MICRAIPYEGKDPYIFVSYCHGDGETLYPLFEQMAMDRYRIWYDDGNHAGDDWMDNIENHLEDCKVCLAFISSKSSHSHNCKSEIIYALKCRKKIIPVLIESTELPKGLRVQMSCLHYLKREDFPSERAMLDKIWQVDECSECKQTGGSVMLRSEAESTPAGQSGSQSASEKGVLFGLSQAEIIRPVPKAEPASLSEEAAPVQKKTKKVSFRIVEKKAAPVPEKDAPESHAPVPDPDDEATVYQKYTVSAPEEEDERTMLFQEGDDSDKTVRVQSWDAAVLLHPAMNCSYILRKPQTKLGRSAIKCDVVIEGNDSISKYHADIIQYEQKFYLRDADSTNGTFLNGERLGSGENTILDNPAVFRLNNETLVLVSGASASRLIRQGAAAFLMNEDMTAIRLIDAPVIPLNRKNRWPDGTLSDLEVHRASHAALHWDENGFFLVDETPEKSNGTFLNDIRLRHGETVPLASGDRIRLGKTTLIFYSITL